MNATKQGIVAKTGNFNTKSLANTSLIIIAKSLKDWIDYELKQIQLTLRRICDWYASFWKHNRMLMSWNVISSKYSPIQEFCAAAVIPIILFLSLYICLKIDQTVGWIIQNLFSERRKKKTHNRELKQRTFFKTDVSIPREEWIENGVSGANVFN